MKYCFLLFTLTAFGQVTEELTVIYKDIRVHVLDKDNNPVRGLSAADFTIVEKGDDREIGYFEEVDLTPVTNAADQPELRVVENDTDSNEPLPRSEETHYKILFIDSNQMTKGNFDRVKQAVASFVDKNTTTRDRVKLVQMDGGFNHLTGFTHDKQLIKEKLQEAKYTGRLLRDIKISQRRINDGIEEWDDSPPDMQDAIAVSVNAFIREKARVKADHYRTFYFNMLSISKMLEHMKGAKSIYLFTSGSYLEVSSSFEDTVDLSDSLTQSLNSANATIYSILYKTPYTIGGSHAALNLRNSVPGFTNSLSRYSSFPPNPDRGETTLAYNTIMEDNTQLESGPASASKSTGGLFLKGYSVNDIDRQLAKVEQVSNHYYRLVYLLQNPKKKTKITIKLKDKQRGWKLLYGKEFEAVKPYLSLKKDERRISFTSMLLYGQEFRDDLDLEWGYHLYSRENGGYRVPVLGHFTAEELPRKGFEFGFVALDEHHEMLDLTTTLLTEIPDLKSIQYYDLLLTEKPPRFIRASVRNMDTGDLSFREFAIDPKHLEGAGQTKISEIVMTTTTSKQKVIGINQIRMMNAKEKDIAEKDATRKKEDPFQIEDRFFNPDIRPYRFQPGALSFLFHLENPGSSDYQMQFLVKSTKGNYNVPGRLVKQWNENEKSIHFQGALNVSNLAPGSYALWIRVVESATKKAYMGNAPFTITNEPVN